MKSLSERLQEEYWQLNGRITRLQTFMLSSKFKKLPEGDRLLLGVQLSYMLNYHGILKGRTERAIKESENEK